MELKVTGRKALIAGGTHGIGRGIVQAFAQGGAQVVFSGRNPQAGAELAAELSGQGADVSFIVGDLLEPATAKDLVDAATAKLGGLDTLVNAAGIYPQHDLDTMALEDWDRVLRTNLTASMLLVQAAIPALESSKRGRIVLISSITGPRTAFPTLTHYGASKAGLDGFIRSAATALGPRGITINGIAPGTILTDTLGGLLSDEELDELRVRIPVHRIGDPQDIAATAIYLASDQAGFITGQSIIIDGGQTLPEFQ
jgi:3-oxoacyl-[acyl-carrier protein] reductase